MLVLDWRRIHIVASFTSSSTDVRANAPQILVIKFERQIRNLINNKTEYKKQ